jgi:hypothetical protein
MIRPVLVDKQSPFLAEECALCKGPFAPGDEIVICPEDAARHHLHCWRANHNKCSAYGCRGQGEVAEREASLTPGPRATAGPLPRARRSKVRAMPSSNFGCARGCLFFGVTLALLFLAAGCFGLWAIADYLMIHVLEWQYRGPLPDFVPHLGLLAPIVLTWLR